MAIEVHFQYSDYSHCLEIVFINHNADGKRHVARPMEVVFEEVGTGEFIQEPTLRLHGSFADAFLKAFAEALDEHGVKTDKDAKIEGTLGATRYHLEDLREMLKLKGSQPEKK